MLHNRLEVHDQSPAGARSSLLPGISVIVPCYRSSAILPELVRRLLETLQGTGQAHEIILVDDGSNDATWGAISRLAADQAAVRGIGLLRNFGQHNATLCGVREARYAISITIDDDLQHPPEEIPALLAALDDAVDIVYAVPRQLQHGLLRNLASTMTKYSMQVALGTEVGRVVFPYRAFRTRLRDAFSNFNAPFVSLDVLLSWGSNRVTAIRVTQHARFEGRSNYNFRKLLLAALNMITGFSTAPLQVAIFVGLGFSLFGLAILAYVVGHYIFVGGALAGFTFLAAMIAIFAGSQLFALGILGEYIGRMYARSLDRPSYAVRHDTDAAGGEF